MVSQVSAEVCPETVGYAQPRYRITPLTWSARGPGNRLSLLEVIMPAASNDLGLCSAIELNGRSEPAHIVAAGPIHFCDSL